MSEEKFNIRLTVVWWCVLFVGAMCSMFFVSMNKTIVIADGSYKQGSASGNSENTEWSREIVLEGTENGTGILMIPLEKTTKAENVVVENCYMDRELHIFIRGAEDEFYAQNSIQGDVDCVYMACRVEQSGGVLLKIKMDSVYEYRTSMEGDVLKVQICDPHELYRMIVVVDPVDDDAQTAVAKQASEIALEVSSLLSNRWDSEDVRLYFTRADGEDATREQCVELVEYAKADMFLHINVAQSEDEQQYGICGWYNELYFIPEFGNVELADIVTRNVTIASGNRAVGLQSAGEESILQDIRVPAAEIDLGYLTNAQERSLLSQSAYREKLADGIADAIREVYSDYYE